MIVKQLQVARNKMARDDTNKIIKKHHIWGMIGIILGILIGVLIITSMGYKYTNYVKKQSYILGGKDALDHLVTIVDLNGGILIENGGKQLVLATYTKPIPELNIGIEEILNSTGETSNETNEAIEVINETSEIAVETPESETLPEAILAEEEMPSEEEIPAEI